MAIGIETAVRAYRLTVSHHPAFCSVSICPMAVSVPWSVVSTDVSFVIRASVFPVSFLSVSCFALWRTMACTGGTRNPALSGSAGREVSNRIISVSMSLRILSNFSNSCNRSAVIALSIRCRKSLFVSVRDALLVTCLVGEQLPRNRAVVSHRAGRYFLNRLAEFVDISPQ